MIKISTVCFILFFALNSCKTGKSGNKVDNTESKVEKVIIDPQFSPKGKNTRMQILEVKEISNEIIEISFNYSGGCKEHSFSLYSTGGLIKTLPPKINIYLVNHQQDDVCRELLTIKKQFDISPALSENNQKTILIFNNRFEYTIEK
ncbi:MAG: hypothetical protein M3Q58_01275 [Bacteroidota bacterium]|nr:hypothetical protein [Bacteroidota bacterium]